MNERRRSARSEAATNYPTRDELDSTPDAALIATLTERGYVVGRLCLVCGHGLTAPLSVERAIGPSCRCATRERPR